MIGELMAKQLIVVKADTSQAKAAIKDLSATEQKAAKERLEAQERDIAMRERSQKSFAMWAAAATAGWALVSSSVKKYEDHLVSLGSRGEAELKRLRDTTGTLTQAQDSLQISIAKVAMAAAPAARALADMADELSRLVTGAASLLDQIPGGSALPTAGKWVRRALPGAGQVGWALGAAQDRWGGGGGSFDTWFQLRQLEAEIAAQNELVSGTALGSGGLQGGDIRSLEQTIAENRKRAGLQPLGAKKRRGGGGFTLAATEIDAGASVVYDENLLRRNRENAFRWQGVGVPQSVLDDLTNLQGGLAKSEERSAMEKIVGPIEQFDAYAIGFGAVSNAATSAYEAIVTGSESAGAAIKRVIGQEIMALGKSMLVRSLQEGAWAISDLAKGNIPGAATHAKAGALFLAGSIAAGSVAAGLGAGGGSGGGYTAAGGIGGGARPTGGGRGESMGLTVVMGDGFADDSPRYRARRVRRAIGQARSLYPESGATEPG